MKFARLNHILIPSTLEEREKLRNKPMVRLLRPFGWFFGAMSEEGRVMTLVALFVGTASLEVSRTQVFVLWAVLFGLLVGSLAIRRFYRLDGAVLEAHAPERVAVGAEIAFQLTLKNGDPSAFHAIRLRGPFLPWDGTFNGTPPRCSALDPGESWTSQIHARFIERGPHHIEPFDACLLLPFGLTVGPHIRSRGCRFTVVPRIAPITSLSVPQGMSQHRGNAQRTYQRSGEAMDLLGVRPYRRGDPIRDLHPKTWARAGVPHIREYQQEFLSRVAVIVDNDLAYTSEDGFEAVLSLAAGVVANLDQADAVLDIIAIGDEVAELGRGTAQSSLDRALDLLAHAKRVARDEADDWFEALEPILSDVGGVFIVTQSTDPTRLALLEQLQERRVACQLLRVHDDTGPRFIASRRPFVPPRAAEERVVRASEIAGEAPINL